MNSSRWIAYSQPSPLMILQSRTSPPSSGTSLERISSRNLAIERRSSCFLAKALGFAGSLGFSEGPALTLLGFAGLSFAPARLLFESLVKVRHASL
jgi:hypothetical protein